MSTKTRIGAYVAAAVVATSAWGGTNTLGTAHEGLLRRSQPAGEAAASVVTNAVNGYLKKCGIANGKIVMVVDSENGKKPVKTAVVFWGSKASPCILCIDIDRKGKIVEVNSAM